MKCSFSKRGDILVMLDLILDYDMLELIAKYSKVLGERAEEYSRILEN